MFMDKKQSFVFFFSIIRLNHNTMVRGKEEFPLINIGPKRQTANNLSNFHLKMFWEGNLVWRDY